VDLKFIDLPGLWQHLSTPSGYLPVTRLGHSLDQDT
jgi:hypothetical protein